MQLAALIDFYQTLTPEDLPRFGEFYAADARFKDPFNDVQGLPAIEGIFRHMFRQVDAPRFVVVDHLAGEGQAMLIWEFFWTPRAWGPWRGRPQIMRGVTHLRFAAGRVIEHRDYWDPGEELLMKLPGIGLGWRLLRRCLSAA